MSYTLAQFGADGRAALERGPLDQALATMADCLAKLLANEAFVKATFNDDMPAGKTELFHDDKTDFYVFAHVQAPGKAGAPHSHGTSWAIYGNARGFTEMTEYKRVNPESEEAVVLTVSDRYRVGEGQSRAYGPHVIHSTEHPQKAWVVRVTGTDLDRLPRFHFRKSRDQLVDAVA